MNERELDESDKAMLRKVQQKLAEANAVLQFASDFFREKYGLTPDNEITPDGRIVTKPTLDGTSILSTIKGESGN